MPPASKKRPAPAASIKKPAKKAKNERSPAASSQRSTRSPGAGSPPKKVMTVTLGDKVMTPWHNYESPKETVQDGAFDGTLYFCEYCFKYTSDIEKICAHNRFCCAEIPGTVVYRSGDQEIYEVDGGEDTLFCQNLCLFARFFLDTKSVVYETAGFRFYLSTSLNPHTHRRRVTGFFSKEKKSWDDYNLACILVLPPYHRQGLGKTLVAFSYELSRREKKMGSPERPLSDLGLRGYQSYWASTILSYLSRLPIGTAITANDISEATYIVADDVREALAYMDVVVQQGNRKVICLDRWKRVVDPAYELDPQGILIPLD
ncbi:histone acetyltransferase, MYST family [Sphaerosporella brunnea]|uniref:histone acetyltransferase n=1 Tax=Sphaerosporella brunnea TaxID=1250544 RepID=A0A5J5EPX0_9PEZI|nr:histone acetyltransferase, MYST family [Sphaerosporella brunnea]